MVLVIKHISIEGPGSLGVFFREKGIDIEIVELADPSPHARGLGKFSRDLSRIDAIVVLGGPMNVYEEEKYCFLKEEDLLLKAAVRKGMPLMGICLGAQLLAKACGARVDRAETEEIGWYNADLTDAGSNDPLFDGVNERLRVFHWHGDTFHIPEGATLLAVSRTCRNQAFRVGRNAYGLQFHIEITKDIIKDWIKAYFAVGDRQLKQKAEAMLADYDMVKDRFDKQADGIYNNFLKIITDRTPAA